MNYLNHLPEGWYGVSKKGVAVKQRVLKLLNEAKKKFPVKSPLKHTSKAIIVPHAGWDYSGLCAASGYLSFLNTELKPNLETKLVILLSTYHAGENGVFTFSDSQLELSDGRKVKVDTEIIQNLNFPFFKVSNSAGIQGEHSMEIQMPFVKYCFPKAKIVPLYIGRLNEEQRGLFAGKLDEINDKYGAKCRWVINSDFLHAYSESHGGMGEYTLPDKDFSEHIVNCERDFYHVLMKSGGDGAENMGGDVKLDKLMKQHSRNGVKPSICGIEALKLWCRTKLYEKLMARMACYYTSGHLERNFVSEDVLKKYSHKGGKIVSYCSICYYNYDERKLAGYKLNKTLTRFEELLLLDNARRSIVMKKDNLSPSIICPVFRVNKGVFVTLKKDGDLRGCIGTFGLEKSILENVPYYANQAAYNDSRFTPVNGINEMKDIKISINLLNDKVLIDTLDKWNIGIDGIIIKSRDDPYKSAIFLPSVPTEQKWNKIDTMENLSLKAGLNKNGWKNNNILKYSIPGYEFEK